MSSGYSPLSVATYYSCLFPARNDVYSRWTQDGWRPLREPMTGEVVLAGLSGQGPSISGYMIAPGSVSHSLAIDFDTEDGLRQAGRLTRKMWSEGMPAYVETSRRGAHVWAALDTVQPAVLIRMALRGLLQAVGLDAHDPKIELRPGTDTVADDGLGHCLRLPLMPHPKTGERGKWLHGDTAKPVGRTMAEIMLEMEVISADRLALWAERYKPPPVDYVSSEYHTPHRPYPEDDSAASEILRDLWGVVNAAPGRSVKCPAHEDSMPSLSILRDDRRAICKAPHCILNNNDRGRGTYELRHLAPHEQ